MNKLSLFLLIIFSSTVIAEGPSVLLFGQTLDLPENCVLVVRPSVLDEKSIKYSCNEGTPNFYSIAMSANNIQDFKSASESLEFVKVSTMAVQPFEYNVIETKIGEIHSICDPEICLEIYSKEQAVLKPLLKQLGL